MFRSCCRLLTSLRCCIRSSSTIFRCLERPGIRVVFLSWLVPSFHLVCIQMALTTRPSGRQSGCLRRSSPSPLMIVSTYFSNRGCPCFLNPCFPSFSLICCPSRWWQIRFRRWRNMFRFPTPIRPLSIRRPSAVHPTASVVWLFVAEST